MEKKEIIVKLSVLKAKVGALEQSQKSLQEEAKHFKDEGVQLEKYLNDFKSFIAKVVEDAKSSNVKLGEVEFELVRVKTSHKSLY